MPRIVFINRFAYPDHSATSQVLWELSRRLARAGHEVAIITSRQRYEDPGAALAAFERAQAVEISRVWSTRFGRGVLAGRALDYLTFFLGATGAVLRTVADGDIVVVMTDPPMLSAFAGPFARMRGARVVNWLQDVFPEIAVELGVRGFRGIAGRVARAVRNRSLIHAQMNVVIGERMATHLESQGVPASRIAVIHNWADGESLTPIDRSRNDLRKAWLPGEKFVVGYSGNFGRAHEFATLLGCAERFRDDAGIVFLFVGGGQQHEAMKDSIERRGLGHLFVFKPYQPHQQLSATLGIPDVHWVSLRPELEGLIVPSKVYGILAAGRPVLMVGDPDGEIGRLVREAGCGVVVRVGDAEAFHRAILALRDDPVERARLGERARALFERRFTPMQAIHAWEAVLTICSANEARTASSKGSEG